MAKGQNNANNIPENQFRSGQSFYAKFPSSIHLVKVHIDHVLPSYYDDVTLIIYRFFGKHKRWWHECMCTSEQMGSYKLLAKKIANENK